MCGSTLRDFSALRSLNSVSDCANPFVFSNYSEHTWDLETIIIKNKDSRINRDHPEKSLGLTTARAAELFDVRALRSSKGLTVLFS